MNTTENNKLIAEFLGYEVINNQSQLWIDLYPKEEQKPLQLLNHVGFHSDWNWLMEVVEKIESLDDEDFNFNISITGVEISNVNNFETIVLCNSGANKITVVYDACVEFIKWYNQQEK